MHEAQLQCGFIIPALKKSWQDSGKNDKIINSLLGHVSAFELKSDFDTDEHRANDSLFLILHNILIRGIPTFCWMDVEKDLVDRLGNFRRLKKLGGEIHEFTGSRQLSELCWKALHLIVPRKKISETPDAYRRKFDSKLEAEFLQNEIPTLYSKGKGDFLVQLFQCQRPFDSLIEGTNIDDHSLEKFINQRADFVLEFPYRNNETEKRGIIIEVDGSHHLRPEQIYLDKQRDTATSISGWNRTFRFPVSDLGTNKWRINLKEIDKCLQHESISILQDNFENPLYESNDGLQALQIALTPFAIARLQMVIVKAILSGVLKLESEVWKIGVVERDVACASIAVDSFRQVCSHLFLLEDKGRSLPRIELQVYSLKEFSSSSNLSNQEFQWIEEANIDFQTYDLCIDIAMLERAGFRNDAPLLRAKSHAFVRSSFFAGKPPKFLCGAPVKWKNILEKEQGVPDINAKRALEFFLRNIFRKETFRPGQLPILNVALQNKSVIGLLPTGGGKSLTYQIAGLLQPGLVLVVDPIKSLMKDQVDSLNRIGINRTVFINSMLKTRNEKEQASRKLTNGYALFCFVSPERLQIEEFRNQLKSLKDSELFFSYGVIDEVHCVSEWGHDFRTSYLFLGKNLKEYCLSFSNTIPLFGLTATASFDVLADVQRELAGSNKSEDQMTEDQIIRHEFTNRNEIQYIIEEVRIENSPTEKNEGTPQKLGSESTTKLMLGNQKKNQILKLLHDIPEKLKHFLNNPDQIVSDEFLELIYPHNRALPTTEEILNNISIDEKILPKYQDKSGESAGIIFTPHRSWVFGVTDKYKKPERASGVYDFLITNTRDIRFGTYLGSDDTQEDHINNNSEQDNINNQDAFLANEVDIMVTTKAFGMGIDKPNIRFTIHQVYPSSIESYVQEAGRAGRDGKIALSIILFNNQAFKFDDNENEPLEIDWEIQQSFHLNNFKGERKEKYVLLELLKEINCPPLENETMIVRDLAEKIVEDFPEKSLALENGYSLNYNDQYNIMWVNDRHRNSYGGLVVDPDNPFMHLKKINSPKKVAESHLLALKEVLASHGRFKKAPEDLKIWLKTKIAETSILGIEPTLNTMSIGEVCEMIIPFTNDIEANIKSIFELCKRIIPEINISHIKNNLNAEAEKFMEDIATKKSKKDWKIIASKYSDSQGQGYNRFINELGTRLNKKRTKIDTEKAIYRLSLIGVIENYTVNWNTKIFKINLVKKSNEDYSNNLRSYLLKFYSSHRVDQVINEIPNRKGDSHIQRLLNFLIEFLYNEIAKKRKEGIHAMRQLCLEGLEKGNVEMKTWIHLYFNSKYARRGYSLELSDEKVNNYRSLSEHIISEGSKEYNVSLQDWTEGGKEQHIEWVFDYMHLMQDDYKGAQIENLKHLRGACTRLTIVNPDNYVFPLLNAFAQILLCESLDWTRVNRKAISESLLKGTESLLRETKGLQVVLDNMNEYFSIIKNQLSPDQEEYFKKISSIFDFVLLKIHIDWVNKFESTLNLQIAPLFTNE